MNDTLWFTTKSNMTHRHALAENGRAVCNSRIRPHLYPVRDGNTTTHYTHDGKTADNFDLASLCVRCQASLAHTAKMNRDKFADWDGRGHQVELIDNADSISLAFSLTSNTATLEFDVRIRPQDLDRLERRIREIRHHRNI